MRAIPGPQRAVSSVKASHARGHHVVELTLECGHVLTVRIPVTRHFGEPSPLSRSGNSKRARQLAEAKTVACIACPRVDADPAAGA